MKYLIFAEICLTVGTPDWVVVVCYVCFALQTLKSFVIGFREGRKSYLKKD